MKVLIAFVTLIALGCAIDEDEMKEARDRENYLMAMAVECSEEVGFDLESGNKLLLGDLTIRSKEAKCFVRCVFKREGFLNEADEPQIKFIVDSLSDSVKLNRKILHKLISKCSKVKNEDPCDSAFKLLECYMKNQAIVKNIEL